MGERDEDAVQVVRLDIKTFSLCLHVCVWCGGRGVVVELDADDSLDHRMCVSCVCASTVVEMSDVRCVGREIDVCV